MISLSRAALLLFACLGCAFQALADEPAEKARAKVEFRRAETKAAEGLTEATVAGTGAKVYLHKTADATNVDIAEARFTVDFNGNPAVEVIFTKEGAKKMAALSEEHMNKPLAILVDGKVISAPRVTAKFSERALITGRFTRDEVDKLIKSISAK